MRPNRRAVITAGIAAGSLPFLRARPSGAIEGRAAPKIGFLSPGPQTYHTAFWTGLQDLGYRDGETVSVLRHVGGGRDDELSAMADALVRRGVAAIVATNSVGVREAMKRTTTIPIVMVTSADPIGSGFIESFAKPGRNVTGLTSIHPELAPKAMQLLRQAVPELKTLAVLWNPQHPAHPAYFEQIRSTVQADGLTILPLEVGHENAIESAFLTAAAAGANGLLVLTDQITIRHRAKVVALANHGRLPAIYPLTEFAHVGGLMAYGVNFADLHYRAASYVARILRGASAAELPVEQPTKFDLVINLGTARDLGLTMPPALLLRADTLNG